MCSDGKCSHVQVIICSCSTHIDQGSIHITRPVSSSHFSPLLQHLGATTLSLPSIQDLIAAVTTACVSAFYRTDAQQSSLQTVNESLLKLKDMNISSRARKYIRNPFRIVGLANRTRVSTQSILSLRLLFNIAVVVIWVLVRRFAEIFGQVESSPLSSSRTRVSGLTVYSTFGPQTN
jgi:hypothetical protein